jgi:EmrB/QacA subfamily drug resistance transporter
MVSVPGTEFRMTREVMTVFIGLMCGMLIASVNLTMVAPAMPTIVAELGGIDHYSWIALSSIVASTVVVPVAGKLSDIWGRRPFYVLGIVIFLCGTSISGLSSSFGMLIVGRVIQGCGMGTMMPLSQAIIGDLIPPRERGKYQGMMGAVFGLAAIVGPVAGGWITDHLSWRWLFFVNVPIGIVTLLVIGAFMHVPHERRRHRIDLLGIATLTLALCSLLLATEMGGSQWDWGSPPSVGLFGFGALMVGCFIWAETRAPEPVLPLRLWRSRVFTLSNLANMGVAMGMFGAIYFIPVFVQGVIGNTASNSGQILVPMLVTMIVASIVNGQLISRTGRYKWVTVAGLVVMGVGFYLLTLMDAHTDNRTVIRNMVLLGVGLGVGMQTFTLIVQNSVSRQDLGVATATTQLFRSIGSAIGVAIMGTLLTQGLRADVPRHLPAGALAAMKASGRSLDAASALDPSLMAKLPPAILAGIRAGMADALHSVFVAGLPFMALAIVAALFIPEVPLRKTAHAGAREAGKEVLVELGQAGEDDGEPVLDEEAERESA